MGLDWEQCIKKSYDATREALRVVEELNLYDLVDLPFQDLEATAATLTVDLAEGHNIYLLLTNSLTTTTFSNPVDGMPYTFVIKQPAAGSKTIAWPAGLILWRGGSAPTLSTTAAKIDVVTLKYCDPLSKYLGEYALDWA